MKVDKVKIDSEGFISDGCHCHFVKPYGFVPEADCKNHDNINFVEYMNSHYSENVLGDMD